MKNLNTPNSLKSISKTNTTLILKKQQITRLVKIINKMKKKIIKYNIRC